MNAGSVGAVVRRALARAVSDRVAIGLALLFLLMVISDLTRLVFAASSADPVDAARAVRASLAGMDSYSIAVGLVATVLGLNALNSDVRQGTIFPVLARPVTRASVFTGSWLASLVVVWTFVVVRLAIVLAFFFSYDGRIDAAMGVGILGLFAGPLLLLSAAAALGGALPVPYGLLGLIGGLMITVRAFTATPGIARQLALALASLLPLCANSGDRLDLLLAGESRAIGQGVEAILYRVAWSLLLVVIGGWLFARRDLAPRT